MTEDAPTGPVHRIAGFRRLWASNALQETGGQFATLALSVTAVTVVGAEAWQVGVISALGLSAYLLIGLPAGVWVDRWPKRSVLVGAELIRAVAAASIAVAYIAGWLTVWQLMAVAAIVSVTSVFSDTAQTAFVPAIVGPARVSEATARLQSTDTSMQVIGPALAAAVLTRLAAPLLYVITSVTGILAALTASLIRAPEPREKGVAPPPFWRSLVEGIAFVRRHPVLRTMLVTNALINAGAGVFATLIVLVALDDLGMTASGYALASGIGATGAIIGSLVAMRIRSRFGPIRTMFVGYCLLPLAALILPSAYILPLPPVVFVAASGFAFGLIVVTTMISSAGLRAEVTPPQLMGRAAAANRFVTQGAMPIGALTAGVVGSATSNGVALLLSPVLLTLAAVAFAVSPLRSHRTLPDEWKHRPAG
ncbi:MAG: MFS transporter [Microbacterium arborescens]